MSNFEANVEIKTFKYSMEINRIHSEGRYLIVHIVSVVGKEP